jgi:hypothetical protein
MRSMAAAMMPRPRLRRRGETKTDEGGQQGRRYDRHLSHEPDYSDAPERGQEKTPVSAGVFSMPLQHRAAR